MTETDHHVDWAIVAVLGSAHQWVHSGLSGQPGLGTDEPHPRKHTGSPGAEQGGRGASQIVADLYPDISVSYRSLYDVSLRPRYDMLKLGDQTLPLARLQFNDVQRFCAQLNGSRDDLPTQQPRWDSAEQGRVFGGGVVGAGILV